MTATHGKRTKLLFLLSPLIMLIVQLYQLTGRSFYWDDIIIANQFGDANQWRIQSFFESYDGHLMPGSLFIQALIHHYAPWQWWLPAFCILLATAGLCILWQKVVIALWGYSLPSFIVYNLLLFSPFLGTTLGWWSASLNALSWQYACSLSILILLSIARSSFSPLHIGILCLSTISFFLLSERTLTLWPALCALLILNSFAPSPRSISRPLHRFFFPSHNLLYACILGLVLTALWSVFFLSRSSLNVATEQGGDSLLYAIPQALQLSLLPAFMGGPWSWDRWTTAPPFATTSTMTTFILAVIALIILIMMFIFSSKRRRSKILCLGLLFSGVYLVLIFLLLDQGRTSTHTSGLLVSSLHYYTDWWTLSVFFIACALIPPFFPTKIQNDSSGKEQISHLSSTVSMRHIVLLCCILVWIFSSIMGRITWRQSWSNDPTPEYFQQLRHSAHRLSTDPSQKAQGYSALLDQSLPLEILTPITEPYNHLSSTLSSWPSIKFSPITTVPRVFSPEGVIEPAYLWAQSHSLDTDSNDRTLNEEERRDNSSRITGELKCHDPIRLGEKRSIPLSENLNFGSWIWSVRMSSTAPLLFHISTMEGQATIPLPAGENRYYIQFLGGGKEISTSISSPQSDNPELCLGVGEIGFLVPADQ